MKFETSCVHATVNSNEWIELDLCHMIMSMSFLFNLVDQLQICFCVGILPQCLAGSSLEMCKEIDTLKVTIFTNMEMRPVPQTLSI